jgi:two-component system phosphate regulon sensor histidine kinase PhoR
MYSMMQNESLFRKILLIEDEAAHALLIERSLKGVGDEVVRAANWTEMGEKLAAGSFDLIISDLHIPGAPGEGPLSAIRNKVPNVPVVVLTSSSSVSDGVAAMRLGAQDFIVKNFDSSFKDVLHLSLHRIAVARALEIEKVKLARDRDILQRAVENSDDGFALVTEAGDIRYCNSAFKKFLQECEATSHTILAISSEAIVNGAAVQEALRQKLASLSEGAVWTSEVISAGSRDFAYDLSLSGVPAGDGSVALAMWVRDIRERKRREKFQKEILSTTTHDLKGPLGAISISCEVLLDKEMEDKRTRQVLERISSSANSAIQLIEEFLSVRRIEEGTFILRPHRQALLPIIARCVETFTLPYETRGITIKVDCHETDLEASVDALAVERVLSNLLSNGMKFTQRGGTVTITAHSSLGGVHLSVRDTGAGMEPSEAQTLFQRYSRLEKHANVAGTGLGLFIVKSVVSAHGGSIEVTSALGEGTTFDLYFPDEPPVNARGEVMCLNF